MLRVGRSWNLNTARTLIDVYGKSAAIKPLQIGSTEVIRGSNKLCSGARYGNSAVTLRLGLARRRRTTASTQQRCQNKRDSRFSSQLGYRSSPDLR